jgi:hypothetical protein
LHGSEDDPDVFDLRDRIVLHEVNLSPQQVGRRYAALEQHLAAVYEGVEIVEAESEADSGENEPGENTIPEETEG